MALFFGRYEHSLDTKGRVVLPARFRSHFASQVFLSQNLEGCVALWTPEEFEKEVVKQADVQDRSTGDRNRVRVWAAGAAEVEIDRQGRVAIPQWLRTYAGLEDSAPVLVTGAIDRVEVWSPVVWEQRVQPSEEAFLNPVDPARTEPVG